MSMVKCRLLGIEAEALTLPPFPGPIGLKILNEISSRGWELWLDRQVKLINEHRLDMSCREHIDLVLRYMKEFFGMMSGSGE